MIREIVEIDETKCNGCGLCAQACHEGAIIMVNGKARLIGDDFCDGLGNCLPACPTGAISIVRREAAAFDLEAVQAAQTAAQNACDADCASCAGTTPTSVTAAAQPSPVTQEPVSRLAQWPIQIKLTPVTASFFAGAHLLVAADCAAYAYGRFHERFMKNRVTLIGCPKLDGVDYAKKLTEILKRNEIKSLTVVRMQVICCGGLERAVVTALRDSGKVIPWQTVTLTADGQILEE